MPALLAPRQEAVAWTVEKAVPAGGSVVLMGAVRMRHSMREIATQPAILSIRLGGKPKWLPLNFGFNDVMCTAPIFEHKRRCGSNFVAVHRRKGKRTEKPAFARIAKVKERCFQNQPQ